TKLPQWNPDRYRKLFDAILQDENCDVVVAYSLGSNTAPRDEFLKVAEDSVEKNGKKPIVVFTRLSETIRYQATTIPIIAEIENAFKAIYALNRYSRFAEKKTTDLPAVNLPNKQAASEIIARIRSRSHYLTEYESKQVLSAYGFEVTREELAESLDDALSAAKRIGYPVALKVQSSEIVHKSDDGMVRLNIRDEEDLAISYTAMLNEARRKFPNASIQGIIVEEMVRGGVETMLGMKYYANCGSAIIFGMGGIYAEVFRDFSLKALPLKAEDVEDMLEETRIHKILKGIRGRPASDVQSLTLDIRRMVALCQDFGSTLSEIDVNPLVIFEEGKGTKVLDARMVTN
ncbi:MAG: acetate--CoA ligase family protein, partial [Nitrososphaerales archaeon]